MPPRRPRSVEVLSGLPRIGARIVRAHDAWLRRLGTRNWDRWNQRAREAFNSSRPTLNPLQHRIVSELHSIGFAHANIEELLPDAAGWLEINDRIKRWLDTDDVRNRQREYQLQGHTPGAWKDFIVQMYGKESVVPFSDPVVKLAIEPAILDIVNSYMGLWSRLIYMDVWDTIPLEHAGADVASQRWHRDPEDFRIVKTFLYVTDVDVDSGPMHYVKGSRTGEKYGRLWPHTIPVGPVVPSKDLERAIPRTDWIIATFPAGTLLFVDTTAFHRGGRAIKNQRVFSTWNYVTPASLWPRLYSLREPSKTLEGPARAALYE